MIAATRWTPFPSGSAVFVGVDVVPEDPVRVQQDRLEGKLQISVFFRQPFAGRKLRCSCRNKNHVEMQSQFAVDNFCLRALVLQSELLNLINDVVFVLQNRKQNVADPDFCCFGEWEKWVWKLKGGGDI